MPSPNRLLVAAGLAVAAVAVATVIAQQPRPPASAGASPADATARIVAAAQALVGTLDQAGRAKVQFPFDGPQKTRWSNLPVGIYQREGLRLGDLTPPQRTAVMTLLTRALSRSGYQKVQDIMQGDEVLRLGGDGRGGGCRGPRRLLSDRRGHGDGGHSKSRGGKQSNR